MDTTELGKLLRESYQNTQKTEKVTMIHLFGIKYAEEIKQCGIAEIIREAGIFSTYRTELGKGIKLAKYVKSC
jgi:hypothetical protein